MSSVPRPSVRSMQPYATVPNGRGNLAVEIQGPGGIAAVPRAPEREQAAEPGNWPSGDVSPGAFALKAGRLITGKPPATRINKGGFIYSLGLGAVPKLRNTSDRAPPTYLPGDWRVRAGGSWDQTEAAVSGCVRGGHGPRGPRGGAPVLAGKAR